MKKRCALWEGKRAHFRVGIAANGRAVVPVPGPMDPDPKGALFP